jgi:beta-ureidopropionase / N-carbamoyl-L-amino-acid hydrolase
VTMRINADRLRADITELATIGRVAAGGLSRTSFSPADVGARDWFRKRCADADLEVTTDGLGNMVVRAGAEPPTTPVWSGSHIDTVPNGGHLDGALGSLAALECLRTLTESGVELAHPVRAVVFADEEGNYDHLFGSTGLRRGYTAEQLAELTGRDGDRLVDRLVDLGWDLDAATRTRIEPGSVHGFVELHIEQGPVLERQGTDIGVVTGIVGLSGSRVSFRGSADHAGTTPMDSRKDALGAAAAFLSRLPGLAAEVDEASVVTCGVIGVEPGGANVVPGVANLLLDFRNPRLDRLEQLERAFEAAARRVAEEHGVEVVWQPDRPVEPVPLDPDVRAVIASVVGDLGLSRTDIPSGAGHDSQNMAWIAPTAMIFIPSINGKSHCPEEDSAWSDIENGANTLLNTLVALANSTAPIGNHLTAPS